MTRVIISEDCGNSPKNILVRDFTVALAKADLKFILKSVNDDIRWDIVGDKVIQGKDSFARALEERRNYRALELTIQHIATHGKAGAVNGTMKLKNKGTHAFSNVYEFSNTKGTSIKSITSYVIEIS